MAGSAEKKIKRDNPPKLGARTSITITNTSGIDSEAQTTKGKAIWEKSPDEVEDEVEALIKSREDSCPERKKRHDEFYKQWDEEVESLDKKHDCTTPSVAPALTASLKKAKEQLAQLEKLHAKIGETMDKLASASAG